MRIAGLDPDTHSITMVILDDTEEPPTVKRIEVKGRTAEDRIEGLWWEFDSWEHIFRFSPPINWVYIERPVMGRNAKALLDQAQVVGVIRSALWEMEQPHSLIDNGTWKKGTIGNGRATKEEIAEYAQRIVGLTGDWPQDVYDAACIAQYGWRVVEGIRNG